MNIGILALCFGILFIAIAVAGEAKQDKTKRVDTEPAVCRYQSELMEILT